MSVLSVRINDEKRKLLKLISVLEGTTIGGLVEIWIDDYIRENRSKYAKELEKNELLSMMKVSEPAFAEWNNPEDEVYNDL
ncbi:MAG: hypothetical protein HQ562_00875 [Candidatus Marinimicrobia bacterium]|nr:hypothetical protein [Candidatus Neomarinimicrobiota bacterium]